MKMNNKKIKSLTDITFTLDNYDLENDPDLTKKDSYDYRSYLNKEFKVLKTKISYLKDTEALTEGDTSLVVGRTGTGKTDLAITQTVEFLLNGHRVFIYVSEGKITNYFKQIQEILKKKRKSNDEIHQLLASVIIKDKDHFPILNPLNYKQWIDLLLRDMKAFNCKILIFDNISTTAFSWAGPAVESGFISHLSEQINIKLLISIFFIHTTRTNNYYKIGKDDIRGNASNSNFVANIFSLNDLRISNQQLRIIEIIKCRSNGSITDTYYQLEYQKLKKRGFYSKSFKISEITANKYFLQNFKPRLNGQKQAKY